MKHIVVVGLDERHLRQLRALPEADRYRFDALLTREQIKQAAQFPVDWLLSEGVKQLQARRGEVDAIVGYWDFPVSTVLPILRRALDLPGPSLEAVLACEHKYWSRRLQAEVAAEHVPPFCAVDPFAQDPLAQVSIDFPFWLKPVKAVLSNLGFRVSDVADFDHAIARIRAEIDRWAAPFNLILERAQIPPSIAAMLDLQRLGGVQCPVMAVSGWADGYSNAVFRLLEHLRVPRLGLIGPWSHKYPHQGVPGPAIGFLQECLRWWDQWLKDIDTKIMREPMLRVWMQDSVPPTTSYSERPGHWVGEPA